MLTQAPGGATEMARALAESGEELRLYACGGDGTIHEVANGVAGFDNVAMTCVPAGTGNDFLKNFGADMAKFSDAENLWDGPVFPLDLIDCNGRLCLTIACNGIDARIADSVHQYGSSPMLNGRKSYLASVAVNFLFRPIGRHWTVSLDGETLEDDFALVSMCNGRYYGGGSTPVPEARMDDGVLHTVLIKNISKRTFAHLFGAYSAGAYRSLPQDLIRVSTAREVRIQSEEDLVTCLDGECIRSRQVTMRLSDRKLNFFGPRGCDPNATARP
jgi:diacylglycerol kinase family enzyme